LRSCIIFWLFSGLDQKSGSAISFSSSWSSIFLAGASKIAPHRLGLLAERGVVALEFFEGHEFRVAMLRSGGETKEDTK